MHFKTYTRSNYRLPSPAAVATPATPAIPVHAVTLALIALALVRRGAAGRK